MIVPCSSLHVSVIWLAAQSFLFQCSTNIHVANPFVNRKGAVE